MPQPADKTSSAYTHTLYVYSLYSINMVGYILFDFMSINNKYENNNNNMPKNNETSYVYTVHLLLQFINLGRWGAMVFHTRNDNIIGL